MNRYDPNGYLIKPRVTPVIGCNGSLWVCAPHPWASRIARYFDLWPDTVPVGLGNDPKSAYQRYREDTDRAFKAMMDMRDDYANTTRSPISRIARWFR